MHDLPLRRSQWESFHTLIVNVAGYLLSTSLITSVLGFVFWFVAARHFAPSVVGLGSAAVSAMVLLGYISSLGVGTTLIREIPRQRDAAGQLIITGMLIVVAASLVMGIIGVIVMPLISRDLGTISSSPGNIMLFILGVCLTTLSGLVDQIYTALLSGQMQFLRNLLFAITKLAALVAISVVLHATFGLQIFACWVFGTSFSLLVMLGLTLMRGEIRSLPRPTWTPVRGLAKMALSNYVLNLELLVPNLAMPVVITVILTTTATAYFSTTLNIVNFIFYAPFALAVSLYAVGSSSPAAVANKVRFTFSLALLLGVLSNIALNIGGGLVLSFFGAAYESHGMMAMRLLALGVFPLIIKDHYVTICRIRGRVAGAMSGLCFGTVLEIVLGSIGARVNGLTGVAIGWDLALALEAAVMLPALIRVMIMPKDALELPATQTLSVDRETMELPAIVAETANAEMASFAMQSHVALSAYAPDAAHMAKDDIKTDALPSLVTKTWKNTTERMRIVGDCASFEE